MGMRKVALVYGVIFAVMALLVVFIFLGGGVLPI